MPRQLFFAVQPRGNHFRVIDQEGYAIGSQYTTPGAAQNYADALNMARNCNRIEPEPESVPAKVDAILLVERHQREARPRPAATPVRPSLFTTLRSLVAKAREYKFVRIGL